jgi:hypothetical protein
MLRAKQAIPVSLVYSRCRFNEVAGARSKGCLAQFAAHGVIAMNAKNGDPFEYRPITFMEEIRHSRILILLIIAIFCLLTGSIWDSGYVDRHRREVISLYEKVKGHTAEPMEVIQQDKGMFLDEKTWINLIKEIGFASLIAFVLIVANEIASHNRHMKLALRVQKTITKSVFHGIFAIDTPREIVDEAIGTIFRSPIIRSDVIMELDCVPIPTSNSEIPLSHFAVRIFFAYNVENKSADAISSFIPLVYDTYNEPELKDLSFIELKFPVFNPSLRV